MYKEIIIPVFIKEYKNENPKYIVWVGLCIGSAYFLEDRKYLRQIIDPKIENYDSFKTILYFYGKSFILDKNQSTLDGLMEWTNLEILINRMEIPNYITNIERYMRFLVLFAENLEKCKYLCRISGNNKWDKILADWELLVNQLYKYEEYVRNNGYIDYKKFLKIAKKKDIFEKDIFNKFFGG
jgi:predicted enzyme involved in methoxymalonyl-ACP biosynthesis